LWSWRGAGYTGSEGYGKNHFADPIADFETQQEHKTFRLLYLDKWWRKNRGIYFDREMMRFAVV